MAEKRKSAAGLEQAHRSVAQFVSSALAARWSSSFKGRRGLERRAVLWLWAMRTVTPASLARRA